MLANTSKQQAEEAVSKFNHSLKEFNQKANRGYDVAFSYGIVESNPDECLTIDQLLVKGDVLMYEVKRAKG